MKLLSASFLLLLSACATAPQNATRFQETKIGTPTDSLSVIVVYRKTVPPLLYPVTLSFNNTPKATLPNKSFTWFYATPRKHKLTVSWPLIALMPSSKIEVEAKPNQTHFVEFSGHMEIAGGTSPVAFSNASANERNNAKALDELKACCKHIEATQ